MKYNYGDKVDDLERYKLCPECGERAAAYAKRPQRDAFCKDGHEWHIDLATLTVKKGHPK